MNGFVGRLSDRLLAYVVPGSTAAAGPPCDYYNRCDYSTRCGGTGVNPLWRRTVLFTNCHYRETCDCTMP